MKLSIRLIGVVGCLSIIGCQNPEAESPVNETIPPAAEPIERQVQIQHDERYCLTESNADASIDYLIGDQQARNLIWSCATYLDEPVGYVEIFAPYSYADQCYKPVVDGVYPSPDLERTGMVFGGCVDAVSVPEVPVYNAEVVDFSITGQNKDVTYTVTIQNTGNISAFFLQGYEYFTSVSGNYEFFAIGKRDYPGLKAGMRYTTADTTYRDQLQNFLPGRTSYFKASVYGMTQGVVLSEQTAAVTFPN